MFWAIQKRTLSTLTDRGILKTHETFRELYAWIPKGVGFALVGFSLPFIPTIIQSSFRQVVLVLIDGVKTFV